MTKLYHSGISQDAQLRQVAVIQRMIADFQRTTQILKVDISTEEERVRVFDPTAPGYPILARTLKARRDNLLATVDALQQRLGETAGAVPQITFPGAPTTVDSAISKRKPAGLNRRTASQRPYVQAHFRL